MDKGLRSSPSRRVPNPDGTGKQDRVDRRSVKSAMLDKRWYVVSRRDIGYLRFILESYDGLLFMRTVDAATGTIEVGFHPSRRQDALALLHALSDEVGLAPADPPRLSDPPAV